MTLHMIWGLIGFNLALLFVWVYHVLRTKGFSYFWGHPILAGIIVIITLYALESFFADISAAQVSLDWKLTLWLGVPLTLLGMLLFYRAIALRHKKMHNKKM